MTHQLSQVDSVQRCERGQRLEAVPEGVLERHLMTSVELAEFLTEVCIVGVKGHLLEAAVDQDMNNLSLLHLPQSQPHKLLECINIVLCNGLKQLLKAVVISHLHALVMGAYPRGYPGIDTIDFITLRSL